MRVQLNKYRTLFATDGIIDDWERNQLETIFSLIEKCESKLNSSNPKTPDSGFRELTKKVADLKKRIESLKTAIKPVVL